jgi:3-oxoadipate enol-lactonase
MVTKSRRDMLHAGYAAVASFGFASTAGMIASEPVFAQDAHVRDFERQALFYREDWFGEPWRKPEAALLIHGNQESSLAWFGWVPRMAQEFRLLRPDLPGLGRAAIPAGLESSLPGLAAYIAQVLNKAGVQSAHVVGAKTGGSIAMQFAADFPERTLSLSVASGPASVIQITTSNIAERKDISAVSTVPQRDRLGSHASKEMLDYWSGMFASAPRDGIKILRTALAKFDLAKEGVLQRIKAPTLVITSDRGGLQTVEKARAYQALIPNSRFLVLQSDAYHIAATDADECVTNVLAFIRETKQKT